MSDPREHPDDVRDQEVHHPEGVPEAEEISEDKHVTGEDPDMKVYEEDPA